MILSNNNMKASHRKTKYGYYPVIIFNDKSRMTHRVSCLTKNMAIIMAEQIIKELEEDAISIDK